MTRGFVAAVMAIALVTATPGSASAQTTAAEHLFDEGRRLMAEKKYEAACAKFRASHEAEASVGALLNLGRCRQLNGQTATAWGTYREAANLARRLGDSKRARVATNLAEKLEPELVYLTIDVPDDARVDGLTIERNGATVDRALWGQRVPVDPGDHAIRAEAPGHQPRQVQVTVESGTEDTRAVIEALDRIPDEPDDDPDGPVPDDTDPDPEQRPIDPRPGPRDRGGGMSGGRKAAIGIAAGGVVGLSVGVVFALRSQSKWDEARETENDAGLPLCDEDNQCDAEGLALANEARDAATISNIAYAAGAILVAGSVALWFLSPSDGGAREAGTVRLIPSAGPDGASVTLDWRF